ncbi:hypothetical protein BUALT_Bualt03G0061000 [Buddleja alternifolia]|uniref:SWIM-type domain-containing protein n=1 Tax=Buddleja alternifolia TaxID=168488 RepID=A0AAV6Y2Q8_9LAMI|nr:hypothetical protein BUALT_Bualt03G0061000 [Buddleja alternifolia]
MIEWIRTRLMSRIQMKKEWMLKYAGVVCPNILKKVNKQSEVARNCTARFCGGQEFEVDHLLDKYVVDLDRKTCTCGMYQLNGYPCCHAYAAIANKRNDVKDYVDVCYKKETYLKVYEYMIHVVPGQRDYIKTNYPPLRAPTIKRKRGRPKKARMRGPGEGLNSTMNGLTHACKNCLEMGHNKGSCTNPTHPNSKLYRGPVADEVPKAPQQTENPATQQSAGFDAPQPTQTSQSAPIGTDGIRASGSNQRPRKPSARDGSANIPTESESTTRKRVHIAVNTPGNKPAPKKKTKRTSISDVLKNIRDRGFEKRPRK